MEATRAKLEALRYKPADWQLPVTEEFVAEFEREHGLRLPAEYRTFLLAFGGWTGSATCEFLEPLTPLGTGAWVDLFYGWMVPMYEVYDIRWATDSVGGAGLRGGRRRRRERVHGGGPVRRPGRRARVLPRPGPAVALGGRGVLPDVPRPAPAYQGVLNTASRRATPSQAGGI
jgi:hypothetical protein